ncbi:MAG TPA: Ku protein, partial [Gemmatimonadaceae bacterium]|nr:Ku protein [Gemmatimonadaceae bacterium]
SLTFGLVNIPVELRTAIRSDHISFRLLHEKDLSPVKYERVCQKEDKPIPWAEIVKGYEYTKGKFVVLTDADFKTAALERSQTIDILDFVKEDEIDPRYFETPYYLVPGKGGDKPYALLREAIRKTGSVGIGKIIIRQSQHLAGVKVVGDALVLEIMRFANELVDASEYNFPSREAIRPQELQMAEQLVGNLAEPFDPSRYTDEYRANLMKIIKAKMKGKKPNLEEPATEAPDSGVLDLMSRLRASLAEGTGKKGAARPRKKTVAAGRKVNKSKKAKTA